MDVLLGKRHDEQEESHWLSVSDLMAGLMMVFLFIAVALMRTAYIDRNKVLDVAVAFQENQLAIYDALIVEFTGDLDSWDAQIDKDTLTVTFQSPEVLFEKGEKELTVKYKSILNEFFPRYMDVLEPFHDSISEVRIEGHTSSEWNNYVTGDVAYFENMRLSQGRTNEVLSYVYYMDVSHQYRYWITKRVAAVGLSSSHLILNAAGDEDKPRSRRVNFRVITNADIQMSKILQGVL
jgi:outer membrane protein OmpA-like peptidoglycan-associated protein